MPTKVLDFESAVKQRTLRELCEVDISNYGNLPYEVQSKLDSIGEKLNPLREELADLYSKNFMLTRKIQNAVIQGDTDAAISIAKSYPDLQERTIVLMGRLSDLLKEESYGN